MSQDFMKTSSDDHLDKAHLKSEKMANVKPVRPTEDSNISFKTNGEILQRSSQRKVRILANWWQRADFRFVEFRIYWKCFFLCRKLVKHLAQTFWILIWRNLPTQAKNPAFHETVSTVKVQAKCFPVKVANVEVGPFVSINLFVRFVLLAENCYHSLSSDLPAHVDCFKQNNGFVRKGYKNLNAVCVLCRTCDACNKHEARLCLINFFVLPTNCMDFADCSFPYTFSFFPSRGSFIIVQNAVRLTILAVIKT